MDFNLDGESITFDCQGCGHKLTEKIGRLKNDPAIECPNCHKTTTVEASGLRKGIKDAENAVADFERSLNRIGKSLK